jgi:hypothetical protein
VERHRWVAGVCVGTMEKRWWWPLDSGGDGQGINVASLKGSCSNAVVRFRVGGGAELGTQTRNG